MVYIMKNYVTNLEEKYINWCLKNTSGVYIYI